MRYCRILEDKRGMAKCRGREIKSYSEAERNQKAKAHY
jgi:hypothetical protein